VVLGEKGIREACLQTFSIWHQGRDFGAYTDRVLEAMRRMDGSLRYVGLVGRAGELVASARELDAELVYRGERIPAMGIAAVFVREDLRGQGYGKRLVQALVADAEERGFQAAYLFSDINPEYYAAHGFTLCHASAWLAPLESLPAEEPLNMRPALPEDQPRLMALYHASLPETLLGTHRNATWWGYFRWWREASGDYVLSLDGHAVGYMNISVRGEVLHVYEWAAPDVPPERVWATVRQYAAAHGLLQIGGWWNPHRAEPWMRRGARQAAIPMIRWLSDCKSYPYGSGVAFEELDHF